MAPIRTAFPALLAMAAMAGPGILFAESASGEATEETERISEEEGSPTEPKPAAPDVNLLRAREDNHVFSVMVDPGEPKVDHRVMLRVDLFTIPKTLDPTFGDRMPVRDASLVAVLTSPGRDEVRRQTLHPLAGAGSYGMHWIPDRHGLWRLSFERRDDELPRVTFQIGVEVSTPEQDDPSLDRGPGGPSRTLGGLERTQRGGGVVGPLTPASAGPTSKSVMSALSAPSGLLDAAFQDSNIETASTALAAIVEEAAKLSGTVPGRHAAAEREYDRIAGELVNRLRAVASAIDEEEMATAQGQWRQTLDNTCAKCHARFWWGISNDLSSWPQVR